MSLQFEYQAGATMVCQHQQINKTCSLSIHLWIVTQKDSAKYDYQELNISLFILSSCQKSIPWINTLQTDTLKVTKHDKVCVYQSGLIEYFLSHDEPTVRYYMKPLGPNSYPLLLPLFSLFCMKDYFSMSTHLLCNLGFGEISLQ